MKTRIISLVITILVTTLWALFFIYILKPQGHVDKTPIPNSEIVWSSILIFIFVYLMAITIFSRNSGDYGDSGGVVNF